MHVDEVFAVEKLSDVPKDLRRGLFLFLFLRLQRVKAHSLICAQGIDVSARIHEASMRDSRSVIDDLVQCIFFFSLGYVENVDKPIGA